MTTTLKANPTSPDTLSRGHLWQIVWFIAWTSFLWDAVLWLVMLGLRRYLNDSTARSVYGAGGIFIFLVIAPWIARLAVQKSFAGFHLVAVRTKDGVETRVLSYIESLSVIWLMLWRLVIVGNIVVIGSWLLLRIQLGPFSTADEGEPGLRGFIELLIDNAVVLPLLYFWLVPAALRKRYSRFSFKVLPD
jgi:hypothetical protein